MTAFALIVGIVWVLSLIGLAFAYANAEEMPDEMAADEDSPALRSFHNRREMQRAGRR